MIFLLLTRLQLTQTAVGNLQHMRATCACRNVLPCCHCCGSWVSQLGKTRNCFPLSALYSAFCYYGGQTTRRHSVSATMKAGPQEDIQFLVLWRLDHKETFSIAPARITPVLCSKYAMSSEQELTFYLWEPCMGSSNTLLLCHYTTLANHLEDGVSSYDWY